MSSTGVLGMNKKFYCEFTEKTVYRALVWAKNEKDARKMLDDFKIFHQMHDETFDVGYFVTDEMPSDKDQCPIIGEEQPNVNPALH